MKYDDIPSYIRGDDYAVDMMWSHLENWIDDLKDELDLDPDFQRAHVWDDDKRTAYVEHIMRGGRSARDLWFNSKGWPTSQEPIVIVDGKQRLESVRRFLRNDLRVFHNLQEGGLLLRDFDETYVPLTWSFKIHVNNLETRREVLEWYLQMNAGGVVHTQKELDKVRRLLQKET